jgi:hypothetical protein
LLQSKTRAPVGLTDGTGANGLVFDGKIVVPGSTILTTGRRGTGAVLAVGSSGNGGNKVVVGAGTVVDAGLTVGVTTVPVTRFGKVPDTT